MECISSIRAAVRGKAPIVAVPVEGHAPVCIDRKRLSVWSKGVKITRAEIVTHYTFTAPQVSYSARFYHPVTGAHLNTPRDPEGPHNRSAGERSLVIEGTTGYGLRSRCRMVAIDRRTAAKTLGAWSEKERARIQKKIMLGALAPAQRKAIKLAGFDGDGDGLVTAKVHMPDVYRTVTPKCGYDRAEGPDHRILMERGGTYTVTGASVTLPGLDDLEFILHRSLTRAGVVQDKGWNVTERRSGLSAGFGDTAEAALLAARTNVSKASADKLVEIRQRIEEQVATFAA